MREILARAESLIEGAVEAQGFEFVHLEYRWEGGLNYIRVFIDKLGGVTVSDCAKVSRQLSVLLDVEDLIRNQYVLEVSSPGIERPLFKEDDYRRFLGKEVRLTSTEKIEARRNFVGHIRGFVEGIVNLECEGRIYAIPFQKIKKANLVYRFK